MKADPFTGAWLGTPQVLRSQPPHGIMWPVRPNSVPNELLHVCFVGAEPSVPPALPRLQASLAPAPAPRQRWHLNSPRQQRRNLPATDAPRQSEPPPPFLAWLFAQAGLDAGAYRPQALQRRLSACLRALKTPSSEAAKSLLERRPELLPVALHAVLIGVSEFFRDDQVFAELRRRVLPDLLKARPDLRVYSAGCSDGQELYSIAMLLQELHALDQASLLGVDCRPGAIARAKAGWYKSVELEGLAPELQERYFQPSRSGARVTAALRARVSWQIGNLLDTAPTPPGWDLVLFRNVAIYLNPERIAEVWERLTTQLRPGGVLVTGKAERPPAGLPLNRIHPCIYKSTRK